MKLRVKLLHEKAKAPHYAHDTDAGADLFTVEPVTLEPGQQASIPTGIALQIPDGHVGLVWDKSGVSAKKKLKTMGGVLDAGYRGEVIVTLANIGSETQAFEVGDKIAQLLIQKVHSPDVEVVDELDETDRGEGGFGSTGR